MPSNCAGTLPPVAGATIPRSVIIMPIAAPSLSGAQPSRRTTVPVRRFGFFVWVARFLSTASRKASTY
ncbi:MULTISPECIES: hypothetical protein [unclassified Streptomyces]|uniref:hypothetical protein n=1 Tax=unclassified Streptomyces TaxID=2593676 RepID=UPI001CBF1385|nr:MULTISPECIES: hypothetical protein [unclassified Streptomyces]WPO69486.1 hypothetical protein R9806_01980 [Streptomyces sp. KN37]